MFWKMVLPVDNFLQKPDDSCDSYQVTHMKYQKNKCSDQKRLLAPFMVLESLRQRKTFVN